MSSPEQPAPPVQRPGLCPPA